MEKLKRYVIFLVGLLISSFGVAFITKAELGTSPISSIPYVLSLQFPFSLGQFTIAFSIILILLQFIILKKNFKKEYLLQIPVSILFGYFIDIAMLLLQYMHPTSYIMKLMDLLLGSLILGFGIYIEILANVVMLPGESFVRAIVVTWNKNFGNTKVIFDACISIIALCFSFLFFHTIQGVGQGTIIAALLVGFIAKFFVKIFSFLPNILFEKVEIK